MFVDTLFTCTLCLVFLRLMNGFADVSINCVEKRKGFDGAIDGEGSIVTVHFHHKLL